MNTILHSAVHEIPLSTLIWMDQLVPGEAAMKLVKVWTLEEWKPILKKTNSTLLEGDASKRVGSPPSGYDQRGATPVSQRQKCSTRNGPNILAIELISSALNTRNGGIDPAELRTIQNWQARVWCTESDRLIIWNLTAMICIYEVASNHHWSDGRSTSNRKHPAVYNKEPLISYRICATSPSSQVTPTLALP